MTYVQADEEYERSRRRAYDGLNEMVDETEGMTALEAKVYAIGESTKTPARRKWHLAYNAIRSKLDHERVSAAALAHTFRATILSLPSVFISYCTAEIFECL